MARAGDEIAAAVGRRGRLRASHADREQVIDVLKAAFVQGQLDKDELDARVGHAFASRTYAELAALTADIPAWQAAAPPPRKPLRAQAGPSVRTSIKMGAGAIAVAAMLEALSLGATWPQIAVAIVAALVFGVIVAAIVISTIVRLANGESWESANRFRRGEQIILLGGFAGLAGVCGSEAGELDGTAPCATAMPTVKAAADMLIRTALTVPPPG